MGLHRTANGWEVYSDADGNVTGRARFSDDRTRRYALIRRWKHALDPMEPGNPNDRLSLTWVMLNPSSAGAQDDDATIRKCAGYAKRWGYGGIRVFNLFDRVETDSSKFRHPQWAATASSPENDRVWEYWLLPANRREWTALELKPDVVVGWGDSATVSHGRACDRGVIGGRDRWAARMFARAGIEPMCLGVTRSGQPLHPSRTPYDLERVPWKVL